MLRRDVLDTTLCDKVCRQVGGFCLCTSVFSTNKTDCHDIAEKLLKVALNTITITIIDIRLTHNNVSARLLILTGRKETTEELQRDQPFNFGLRVNFILPNFIEKKKLTLKMQNYLTLSCDNLIFRP